MKSERASPGSGNMEWMAFIKSLFRVLFCVFVAIPLIIYPLLYVFQERLIFLRAKLHDGGLEWIRKNCPGTEFRITTPDHVALHGWFVNRGGSGRAPLLIYFGGNAEEVSGFLYDAARLDGWSVLLTNYRGYGLSQGSPSESALFRDAVFLYDEFSKRNDVEAENIVAMGRSLGNTGPTTIKASEKDIIQVEPVGLIEKEDGKIAWQTAKVIKLQTDMDEPDELGKIKKLIIKK